MQESCFTIILLFNVILQASEEQIVAISKEITPKTCLLWTMLIGLLQIYMFSAYKCLWQS